MPEYTEFAPAERLSKEEILKQHNKLLSSEIFNKQIFNKIPMIILILNKYRQVVFANDFFKKIVKIDTLDSVLGLRPGEIFSCIYSDITKGGCGTTKFCQYCGAVNAILASIKGVSDIRECRIVQKDGNTVFLEVAASPSEFAGDCYSIFSIKDISNEKKRLYLEKQILSKFFNDLSEIKIASEILKENDEDEIIKTLDNKIKTLLNEITFQKLVIEAENFKLDVNPVSLNTSELLKEISEKFNQYKEIIKVSPSLENINFVSDYNLLFQVLTLCIQYNLNKIDEGSKILLNSAKKGKNVVITIQSSNVIPMNIQYKLFQKDYFSNIKESQIETYLMHLITNRYLKGNVLVSSNKDNGTMFSFYLPLDLEKILNKSLED